ncbi:claudin-34 [Paroedura picta]|uniref:claudin-34 n=1 Tax=Paroedura picta TaxID=143630 RepID=UPI004056E30C
MGVSGEDSQLASFLAQASFFQLCGFVLAAIGWGLCISATTLGKWRQWLIEDSIDYQAGVMWIGIWDVCYEVYSPDPEAEVHCKTFDVGHVFLPKEIFIAQDLMSLCSVVKTVALGFFFFAFWNIIKSDNKNKITSTFFTIGGLLSLTTGILILIPVTWNMFSVMNKKNIIFPETFKMPSHPKEQFVGIAIHLGLISAILQIVSGLLFLSNKCLFIRQKTHPLKSGISKDSENCPRCGSSLNILNSGHYKRFCEGGKTKKSPAKPEVTFHIPMGPIPDQRVAHVDIKPIGIFGEPAFF